MFFSILAGILHNKHFWPAAHFKDISGELAQIIAVTGLLTERATSVPKASQFHHLISEICIFLLLGHPTLGACVQLPPSSACLHNTGPPRVPALTKGILCSGEVTLILTQSSMNPNKAPAHD